LFEKNLNHVNYYAGELVLYENQNKRGLVIQTSPDSLNLLTEQNQFECIKISEVRKKIAYDKRLMMAVDCENNVITRGTIVKIKDKNSPLRGQLGEIRAMHKEVLFLWVKNTLLSKSNGFYCTQAKLVLNAGAQHLKEANQAAGISVGDNQAHLDRNKKEGLLRN
jgi:hypothetical protein